MNPPQPDPLEPFWTQARAQRPAPDLAEFGFETRLLARLRERRSRRESETFAALWARFSWQFLPACAAAILVLAVVQTEVSTQALEAEQIAGAEAIGPGTLLGDLE